MDVVIWGGPVSTSDIADVHWQSNVRVVTVNHGIAGPDGNDIGSSAFGNLAASLRDANGRILPRLLASRGIDVNQVDHVALAGFSAFHGLAEPILRAEPESVTAMIALDACFSAYGGSYVKKGYELFGDLAVLGERLFVMTASSGGGGTYTTGFECVLANAEEIAPDAQDYVPPFPVPEPITGLKKGGFIALDYRSLYTHGGHVHDLAVPILDTYLAPYLAGKFTDVGNAFAEMVGIGWDFDMKPALLAAGVVIGAATGLYFATRD